ncbi:S8 family serine peptidase [Haloarcula sp. Atlit-120R]|uniref:S8 family peptidase n=1 Tax=Haloarcula sp. Atlit-120R TaxID=2282135 RepID=UPI001314DE5D|nr:S8 family serine peptidase [Haloarcula sp. Atlit-120R]
MTRTLTTAVVALLMVTAVVAPATAQAADSGPLGPEITAGQEWVRGFNIADDGIMHGSTGEPTWIVNTDDPDALSSWANASESRAVVRSAGQNRSVVAASPGEMGLTRLAAIFDNGLATNSYVLSIAPNRDLTLAEPVSQSSIPTAENATAPENWQSWRPFGLQSEYPDNGIAYRDSTNVTTMAQARQTIGADNVSETGAGVTVAVIDTGVNHANGTIGLKDNISPESKDFVDDETGVESVSDPQGHGSWVASAVASDPDDTVADETYEGVAPDATILGLRVLDEDGSGSTADIAEAVRYAESNDADVLAMSLGSQRYTPEVASAIRDACAGNVTTVSVAAGNARMQGSPYLASPADTPEDCVVSVAASNTSDPDTAGVASFSQLGSDPATTDMSGGVTRGEGIDVTAPGMQVNATVARTDETQRYQVLSGTSMAQPLVAGSAAQLLEANSTLVNDSEQTKARLTVTARRMPQAAEVEAGHGMVASDRAIADNQTEQSQADAMDETAQRRDTFWREAGSDGLVSGILSRIEA